MRAVCTTNTKSIEIRHIPKPKPNDDQILIKTVAFAANPTDYKHHYLYTDGGILGSDASGIVEEVGNNVTGYKVGDIVATYDHGNVDQRGKFAEYVLGNPDATFKVDKAGFSSASLSVGQHPSSSLDTYEALASIALGLGTVGVSFNYHLQMPRDNNNAYILIWGGSTATGIVAIQVAKLVYNIKVITTCSAKNFGLVKSLGAEMAFDYHDPNVVANIKQFAKGKITYALDTVGFQESIQQTYDATNGSNTKVIDALLPVEPKLDPSRNVKITGTLVYNALGEPMTLSDKPIPDIDLLVKSYKQFWYELVPPIIAKLKTANLRVLPPGLETAPQALELLQTNQVSGEKLIFRF